MLNVVALMGRLTSDPELRHTQTGIAITKFTIAVQRSFVRPGEERKSDFIDIVAWRSTAEFVCTYFKKGQLVALDGAIQTGTYQDKDGNKRKSFEVIASNVHFAESKKDSFPENGGRSFIENKTETKYSSGTDSDFQEIQSDDDLPF